jgi:hydrogenase maturation protease
VSLRRTGLSHPSLRGRCDRSNLSSGQAPQSQEGEIARPSARNDEKYMDSMTKVQDILILGIGNILLKDEGIGVHVVNKMKGLPLPGNVEILDGGTAGLDLTDFIANRKKVIVIDTVKAGEKPGTIYRLTEKNLRTGQKAIMSFHEIDFLDALYMSEVMGEKPEETVVIGIEPKDMSDGTELSPEIEERIPIVINAVLKELNNRNDQ